ncbi:glycosyltransferase [Candidatus Magnetoovum chiemensis]|nr:glycosyltransferase [Candidatus Magnetoovum chiemensis]
MPIRETLLQEITSIHLASFNTDFITSLGKEFVRDIYYMPILESRLGFGFVCMLNDKVIGFIVGSYDSEKIQKLRIKKNWLKILLIIVRKIISKPYSIIGILKAFLIVKSKYLKNDAQAELVSLAVLPQFRGQGVAMRLINEFKRHLKEEGMVSCWTKTHSNAAGRVYEKAGFIKQNTFQLHKRENNVFVCNLT